EPLLNEDVWQMVSLARDKGIASKVDTNGMLIGRYKDEIFKSGLEILNIAFEGLSEKSTTRFRAGYDYRLVVNNIKMLCDQKRKLGVRNPSIALNFLVRKDNEDEIRRAIELMREWKVDVVTLKSINISPSAWLTDERIQYLGNEFLPVKNTRFSRYARKGGKWVPKPYISDFCRYLPNSVTITWDGKVLPCCFDYDSSMVAGNIHDRSLRTIWRSGEFKDIRRKVYKGSPPLCKNCTSVSLQKKITLG
ncbi:MAG: radical SAM/SPASM domain-containing protein, partial [Candidatus Omnitrophica bacterium]|nr:radical SAM/SPASM domain-containing protein [Candidatus Omnitrophota bacterium]